VTPRGVPDGDMPDRPQPEYRGYPPFGDGDLDAWLAGYTAVASPAVDDALSALLAPPSRGELADESAAMAEFRRVHSRRSFPPSHAAVPHRRRPRRRSGLSQSVTWLGAAAAVLAIAVFGAATVTGRIPDPIQDIAHVVFASHPSEAPAGSSHAAVRPASGPATSHELPSPSPSPSRPATKEPNPTSRPTSGGGPSHVPGTHTSSGNGSGSGSDSGSGSGSGNHNRADSAGQATRFTSFTVPGDSDTPTGGNHGGPSSGPGNPRSGAPHGSGSGGSGSGGSGSGSGRSHGQGSGGSGSGGSAPSGSRGSGAGASGSGGSVSGASAPSGSKSGGSASGGSASGGSHRSGTGGGRGSASGTPSDSGTPSESGAPASRTSRGAGSHDSPTPNNV
jgi:hypothetical protein